jgi:hypothetical protein
VIVDLLKNEESRKEMAFHCRRIATQEYALEIQARRYVDLYEDVLGMRRGDAWQESQGAARRGPETRVPYSLPGLIRHPGSSS